MKVQVIGSGSWGLALARILAKNNHDVLLWCRPEDNPEELRSTRESKVFLPGVFMPDNVNVVDYVDPDVEIAVFAVPSHVLRIVAERFPLSDSTIRVNVAKGIERGTLLRMSEVMEEAGQGGPVVTLSGPSHAEEVGNDLPASLVAASKSEDAAHKVQEAFFGTTFRVYSSTDIIGVEMGGSLKNVIAIAAGTCDGLGLGDNAKAALITRGLAEISRLGVACGADPITFAGLSGMGDLIVTCDSRHSRNRRVGEGIAQGKTIEEILDGPMVAEGVNTTESAHALAQKMNVDMPITAAVHTVLFEGLNAGEALARLLSRDKRPEQD